MDAHYRLGASLYAQGRVPEAEAAWSAGAQAYPGHAYARRCREALGHEARAGRA